MFKSFDSALLIIFFSFLTFPIFSSFFTEQGCESYFVDYLSKLSQEEKEQIYEIFLETELESKQSILVLALLPVRCPNCEKVERQLRNALGKKELSPLMQMHTLSRWSHCLVHNPKLTRNNKDSFCPVLIAIHTETHKQLFRQELTKIKGYSTEFFNGVIASSCN